MSWNWVKDVMRSSLYLAILSLALVALLAGLAPDPVGRWAVNFWLWVDQGVNSVILLGDPQETISSRLGKILIAGQGWWSSAVAEGTCWVLDLFDGGHCAASVDPNVGGRAVL